MEARHGPVLVRAAIESMNGARFVRDELEQLGWEVEVADAQKVKGLGPLACKTDRIDAWVLGSPPAGSWCRRFGCPGLSSARSVSGRGGRCSWSVSAARSRSLAPLLGVDDLQVA